MNKIISVVGARPNFMKMAPIHKQLLKHRSKVTHKIVHTGQHYDKKMSDIFIEELDLPKPHIHLSIGSRSHAELVAMIMMEFEKIILKEKPDLVLVYGDINSTAAAVMVCSKILTKSGRTIPIAHIESGLRSFDRTMPEEINRMVTDVLADYLFVTEPSGVKNLKKEGISSNKIFFVGNTMIDSLEFYLKKSKLSNVLKELCISEKKYTLVTLHRPSNVDSKENLNKIISIFKNINKIDPSLDIVFPVHPRTIKMLEKFGLKDIFYSIKNLIVTEPFGYLDFLNLIQNAKFILTDSGGIQEETTFLKVPCITLRENTERPVTSEIGTNVICGLDEKKIIKHIKEIESGKFKKGKIPKLWDGKAAERIVKVLLKKIK
ncbi:MAG TPA: UDP-N-acetylglucosamine 2-epimerase (non-hydrolyzing) [Ignavibacteria bacterium]|nr:UDP-N-acetylglucosamine 2-epimerase (non-hydrolyzing) [Ignavibacteria bacterium]HQY52455.1 UDP-N-acetylglucosamine 2-epimerase (non-hydrolyzing) [Ignavibacteria bacterium]HRB00047.1 UDP-N-acetylglucosamine 2-epimerase (non-hydrolyzing) [Ignavibacteria bacterium]